MMDRPDPVRPHDAISDPGVEGGVDEPNEGAEPPYEPEDEEPEAPGT
jgi:hypothetical protein